MPSSILSQTKKSQDLTNTLNLEKSKIYHRKANRRKEKSHICDEGGAHHRISFWHLLMNLKKNNY